ncbi:hypothetical protein PFISCL1PPCAC_5007, partial [Pristionchus fissidentatus]
QFSFDYAPSKSGECIDKLPSRSTERPPYKASGIPQYLSYAEQAHVVAAAAAEHAAVTVPTTTTTTEPTTTTTNGYNAMGWQTDDDGNVFVGDDNAKLLLIQMPPKKYWDPLPKDWPEAEIFGSMFPDSKHYRG